MWALIKHVSQSRLGHLLLTLHLCLLLYYFAQLNEVHSFSDTPTLEHVTSDLLIGGRFVHFNSMFWLIWIIDIIPLVVCKPLLQVDIELFPHLSVNVVSWLQAGQIVLLTSIQWLLVGYFIERMIKLYRASRQ